MDCLLQHATLVFSRETFQELETRLWRPKFDRYLNIDHRRLLLHDFAAAAQWVDLPVAPRPTYYRDPNGDVFLHTALHGKAEWLVSGDKDLLEFPSADWGESSRVLRRLHFLRECSHEQEQQVFP